MATYTKETALYDTAAIAGDISDAATKATNYLSADSSGIMVYDGSSGAQTPSNPSANTNNVFIDSNSLDIRKGTEVLATFGSNVIIGKENYGHVEIDDTGMTVWGNQDGSIVSNVSSYMTSNYAVVGANGDLATLSLGSLRTTITSNFANNYALTEFRTNTSSSTSTTEVAQTNMTAHSLGTNTDASISVQVNDNLGETSVLVNADNLEWNGNSIPMVIEQGTSGIWTYRKWSDGVAECWGSYGQSVNANSTVNNIYINFPFTFTAIPVCIVGVKAGGANYYRAHCVADSTLTTRLRLCLTNSYSASANVAAECHVIGRWK